MDSVTYWLEQIGAGLALAGGLLAVIGSIGVLRFPDFYTRLHAASITDTGAATLLLFGLALMAGVSQEALKLIIAWAFIMLTSPTATHALANAAWSSGHKPRLGAFEVMSGKQKPAPQTASGDKAELGLLNPEPNGKNGKEGQAS